MGRGEPTVPVVESWTILAMAAAATERVTVGPFVLNVMNRHPAVVARMASTLQIASGGRLVLGVGIGGAPREHEAYGIDFPAAPERVARLEEAVAVIRALWTGGPVTRDSPYYPLRDAYAHPLPVPPPPIIVGGETAAGARLAGRIGDGWSAFDDNFEANLPLYLESLAASGRRREDQRVIVGFQGTGPMSRSSAPWVSAPRETWALGAAGATRRSSSPGPRPTWTRWWRPPSLVGLFMVRGTIRPVTPPTLT
jgi:alkanesulfonate monooxygenase SsuD/methylene tetrahydromethanopterin reductase-like flavin-dependent oxidoreductase (luciferase family)